MGWCLRAYACLTGQNPAIFHSELECYGARRIAWAEALKPLCQSKASFFGCAKINRQSGKIGNGLMETLLSCGQTQ